MINFKNKKILITGATGGIGGSLVRKFSSLGGIVLGTGTKLEKLDVIKKENPEIKTKKFNLSEHNEIENFINSTTSELGGLDILINNAGMNIDNLSLRMKDDEWQSVIDTNLGSMFRVTKLCLRAMTKARWGRVVNISSVVGSSGNPGQTNYAASKAGIEGFTRSLAKEIGSRGITVNSVAPGFIETDMTRRLEGEQTKKLLLQVPLRRLGKPEEIASVVGFLVSEDANYITGETIHVNGGMYICLLYTSPSPRDS